MADTSVTSSAVLSRCGRYRYRLDRSWGAGPTMGFVMLNPSTADATADDPTIRRCIGFARREGCGGIAVANLNPCRASSPADIWEIDDQVWIRNWTYLHDMVRQIDGPLVAAWGAHRMVRLMARHMVDMARGRLLCLGVTRDGSPRHPLYVRGDAPLLPFQRAGRAAGDSEMDGWDGSGSCPKCQGDGCDPTGACRYDE